MIVAVSAFLLVLGVGLMNEEGWPGLFGAVLLGLFCGVISARRD